MKIVELANGRKRMEQIMEGARECTTDQILEGVVALKDAVSKHGRMARAALIEVYKEREGEEAAEVLMDSIGL